MDQRDYAAGNAPTFYYMIYYGGELTQGCQCAVLTVYPMMRAPVQAGDLLTRVENYGRGWAQYCGVLETRPGAGLGSLNISGLPYAASHTSPGFVLAGLLEDLHKRYAAMGPFLALPCSPFSFKE